MKLLSKKDYAILTLFFASLFIASTLGTYRMFWNYNSDFQSVLVSNLALHAFSWVGYILTMPVLLVFMTPVYVVTMLGGDHSPFFFFATQFSPLLTAGMYSFILMFLLAMSNAKSRVSKKPSIK